MSLAANDRRIDYVEFLVRDLARSRAFYGAAFGWTFTEYGPAYLAFNDGRLDGGFELGEPRPGGPLVILYATDLEAVQVQVQAAGGVIAKPIFAFPGGRRFQFTDPDGYELGVWSEK
jgi:predicted enzyme related to lactoylglutathione lyase